VELLASRDFVVLGEDFGEDLGDFGEDFRSDGFEAGGGVARTDGFETGGGVLGSEADFSVPFCH
jgi:hypothetical protein